MKNIDVEIDFFEETISGTDKYLQEKKTTKNDYSRIDFCKVISVGEVEGYSIVYFRITSRPDTGFSNRLENMLEANLAEDISPPAPGSTGIVAGIYGNGSGDKFVYLATLMQGNDNTKNFQETTRKEPNDFLIQKQHSGLHLSGVKNYARFSNSSCAMVFDRSKVSIGDKQNNYGLTVDTDTISLKTNENVNQLVMSKTGALISSRQQITLATNGDLNLIGKNIRFKSIDSLEDPEEDALPYVSNDKNHIHGVSSKYEISSGYYGVKVLSKNIATYNPLINPISPKPSYVIDILEGGSQFNIGSGDFEVNLLNSAPFIGSGFKVNIGTIPFLNSSEMILETGNFEVTTSLVPGALASYCTLLMDTTTTPKIKMGYHAVKGMMLSGFEATTSKVLMSYGPFGMNSITIKPTGITIGAMYGARTEKMVLGESLMTQLGVIMDLISAITVITAVGPSSPPVNSAMFQMQKAILKLKCLSFFNKNN